MATTPSFTSSISRAEAEPLVEAPLAVIAAPKVQPLWRFALVGLGPLAGVALLGLLAALLQHPG
jgi:hypothetical protein